MENAIFFKDVNGRPVMTIILHDDRITTLEKLSAVISRKVSRIAGSVNQFTGKALVETIRKGKRRPYASGH